jgi:hypothetical protein
MRAAHFGQKKGVCTLLEKGAAFRVLGYNLGLRLNLDAFMLMYVNLSGLNQH